MQEKVSEAMRGSVIVAAGIAMLFGSLPDAYAADRPAAHHPAYKMTTKYRVYWLGLPGGFGFDRRLSRRLNC